MAPSQLKQLKAALHDRRQAGNSQKTKPGQRPTAPASTPVKKRPQKNYGEETRRGTLLLELRRRNKVGGIIDRRFGENDPTMAPEERMLQRFTKQKNADSMFNLEDDEEDETLTHLGRALDWNSNGAKIREDFDEADLALVDEEDGAPRAKRRRLSEDQSENGDATNGLHADHKKSRREIMDEVIAKSKLHKYERQKTKEDDDALRGRVGQRFT